MAVRVCLWAARRFSRRLARWVWLFPSVWVCPSSPVRSPVVGKRESVRLVRHQVLGVSWGACASGGRAMSTGGGAVLVLPLWRSLPARAPWCLAAPPAHFTQPQSSRRAGADHQTSCPGPGRGGGLWARGPGAAMARIWGGGCAWPARGTGSAVLLVGGGGRGHGTAVARVAALFGAGASVAEAGVGGCVSVARGTGSAVLFKGGGGRGHRTALACVAVVGGAGASVARAWGGGRASVERGTGSAVLFTGGGGRGHGTALACVLALGAGTWGVMAAPRGAGAAQVS